MGFIDGRIVQDVDGKSISEKLSLLNSTLTENTSGIANISNTINDMTSKSKFEKISFPISKSPNNLKFNSTEKYYFEPMFRIPSNDTMQGIAFYDGYVYIGFDMGNGKGSIRKYDTGGNLIKDSGLLGLNHTADLAYRNSNGHIYVVNGGSSNPTFVYEVDMSVTTPSIISTLNFNSLGNSGLLAIDNEHDQLIIHTATNDTGVPTFSICKFDGTILSQFTIPNQGVPQGMDYYQNQIYFYTNNKITVMDLKGVIISTIPVPKTGESEGIAIAGDYTTPFIIVGYNQPNRVYTLRSTDNQAQFHSYHPLTSVNRYDAPTKPLVPTMLTMAINTNLGVGNWQPAQWENGFNWQNIIDTITTTSGASGKITITLKHPIKSVGYFGCNENFALASQGYRAVCDFVDPATIIINIYNNVGTIVDPTTINTLRTIKILVVGAIDIND
jgi:hypothetical protein